MNKNYQNIEILQIERKMLRTELHKSASQSQFVIDQYNGKDPKDILFHDLDKLPLDETIYLNDRVSVCKEYSSDLKIIFKSRFRTNGTVRIHKHSDCLEDVYVRSGCIYEAVSGVTYNEGDNITIAVNELHQLIAIENSYLDVTVLKI